MWPITDRPGAQSQFFVLFKVNLLLSIGVALLMMLLAPIIIPLVFGTGFQESVYPATVLLIGTVLFGCNYVLANGLRGLGFPQLPSLAEIIALCVTVVGLVLFLSDYGMMGAGLDISDCLRGCDRYSMAGT